MRFKDSHGSDHLGVPIRFANEPALASDILWGAAALLELEARWVRHLLDAWERGESSLLAPRAA